MSYSIVPYIFILLTVVFTVIGQIIIKWRLPVFGQLPLGFQEKFVILFKLVIDPYIIVGFISAFLAAIFWILAIMKLDLSYAYPLIISTLTIVIAFAGILFLGESISVFKIMGLFLIVCGVYVISK